MYECLHLQKWVTPPFFGAAPHPRILAPPACRDATVHMRTGGYPGGARAEFPNHASTRVATQSYNLVSLSFVPNGYAQRHGCDVRASLTRAAWRKFSLKSSMAVMATIATALLSTCVCTASGSSPEPKPAREVAPYPPMHWHSWNT